MNSLVEAEKVPNKNLKTLGREKHFSAVTGHPKTQSQRQCVVGTFPSENWR